MAELFPIPLAEQIAAVEREISFRQRVYPRRIEARKMTRQSADRELARMTAVLDTLVWLRDHHE